MPDDQSLSLQEMYDTFSDEMEELKVKIDKNLTHISEIDEYLNSIYNKEEEDFKVFSPRNVESIYKEDIEHHKAEKYKLENDNKLMYSRFNKLSKYKDALKNALQEESLENNLKVLDIQEKERQRIARDLHDTSLQNLTHLVHKIEIASMYIDKDTLQAKLELATINKKLKLIIDEIRNTIFDLRPMSFDDLGLKESFERLFDKLKQSNPSFDIQYDIDKIECDNNLVLMTIFRVVQEACFNAIKHSGGNKINVTVKQQDNSCSIVVKDNGLGFSIEDTTKKEDRHFGVAVMKERISLLKGNVTFNSELGMGAEIRIKIPL